LHPQLLLAFFFVAAFFFTVFFLAGMFYPPLFLSLVQNSFAPSPLDSF
jgi:hypothetical protein